MADNPEENTVALSIIVLSWNTMDITTACIDSIVMNPPDVTWELILIDNASSDGSGEYLKSRYGSKPNFRVIINEKNLGFTGGNNQGIELARGKAIMLLNSDTIVPRGAFTDLYSYLMKHEDVAVVGPKLTHEDGSPTTSFGYFPSFSSIFTTAFLPGSIYGNARKALGVIPDKTMKDPMEVDYVSGAAFMFRRDVVDLAGMLDDRTFFAYFEETDWCMRIKKAGRRVVFVPSASIIHLEGKSFEKMTGHRRLLQYDSAKKFFRKHYSPPMLLWFKFCTVIGSLVKVVYFGLRMLIQPGKKKAFLPHYRWNAFVFELWKRGLNRDRGTNG